MSAALIGILAVALLYIGKRHNSSNAEIAQLRIQVASLKRFPKRK